MVALDSMVDPSLWVKLTDYFSPDIANTVQKYKKHNETGSLKTGDFGTLRLRPRRDMLKLNCEKWPAIIVSYD